MFPPSLPPRSLSLAAAAIAAFLTAPLCAQTTVYSADATRTFRTSNIAKGEIASGVHLEETDQEVTSIAIPFYSVAPTTATITLSLYAAVPGSNQSLSPIFSKLEPAATPFWTGDTQEYVFTGPGQDRHQFQALIFSGINTLVPQDFFWAVTIDSKIQQVPGGPPGPPIDVLAAFGIRNADQLSVAQSPYTYTGGQWAATSAGIAYVRELGHEADPETGLDPWSSATIYMGVSNGVPSNLPVNVTLAAQITAVPEASVSVLMGGCFIAGCLRRRR